MMTSFTRILVVLSILRQAVGLQQSPPNQVLIGLSLFLSLFVMAPTLEKRERTGDRALLGRHDQRGAGNRSGWRGLPRLHDPPDPRARPRHVRRAWPRRRSSPAPQDVPFSILLPAFVTSELKTAFQIGFMLFLPFLVIDLVVSSVLMSLGMMMMSPTVVSLPFKLLLFVLVDGWALLMGSLASSFG